MELPPADDVVLTSESLRLEVPEGFTLKGKVFEVEEETQFWNDEYVPMAFNILTDEGEGIGFGFDTSSYPSRPSLAEAVWTLLEEGYLLTAAFSRDELKMLYEAALQVHKKLLTLEENIVAERQGYIHTLEEDLEALKPDYIDELESRFNGE